MNQYKDDNIEKYPLHIDILCIISVYKKQAIFYAKIGVVQHKKVPLQLVNIRF